MQPSLAARLRIAYTELTANSDLIKQHREESGFHSGLLSLYITAISDQCLRQTFRTAYETQGKSYDRMDFFQTQY